MFFLRAITRSSSLPSDSNLRITSVLVAIMAVLVSTSGAAPTATSNAPQQAPLPSQWVSQDIGSVGLTGGVSYTDGTYTINGSGADIWNTADAFHYVYQPFGGDAEIVARVAGVPEHRLVGKGRGNDPREPDSRIASRDDGVDARQRSGVSGAGEQRGR